MSADYDPPYESEIEDIFAWNIIKYLSPIVILDKQVEYSTFCGNFRVDFVGSLKARYVGLECDGRDYHDAERDQWRDAILVGSSLLNAIYHFPGKGIYYHVEGCLAGLLLWEPDLFSERGRINLGILAPEVVRRFDKRKESLAFLREVGRLFIPWPPREDGKQTRDPETGQSRPPAGFDITGTCDTPSSAYWREYYNFAVSKGGGDLDTLIEEWRNLRA